MNNYINKKGGNPRATRANQSRAFNALGRALHSAMDSTSPAHVGWQHFGLSNFFDHGSWSSSLEDTNTAKQSQHMEETLAAMSAVMNGRSLCECEQ